MDSRKLDTFISRLDKLGIKIDLVLNVPWIYLDKINGTKVTERFWADHGFTIAFYPLKTDQELKFLDIAATFKLIRKYISKI